MAEVAREPLVQEIRLTWWAEALDEIFDDRPPRRHPVVEALAVVVGRSRPPRAAFAAMIDARLDALETPVLSDETAVHRYLDATAGALMGLAAGVLTPESADAESLGPAARAWGLAGLARMRAAGQDRLPEAWDAAEIRLRVGAAVAEARSALKGLPVAAFPAVVYVTLANAYAEGRAPSALEKRLRLTGAVLTGRI